MKKQKIVKKLVLIKNTEKILSLTRGGDPPPDEGGHCQQSCSVTVCYV